MSAKYKYLHHRGDSSSGSSSTTEFPDLPSDQIDEILADFDIARLDPDFFLPSSPDTENFQTANSTLNQTIRMSDTTEKLVIDEAESADVDMEPGEIPEGTPLAQGTPSSVQPVEPIDPVDVLDLFSDINDRHNWISAQNPPSTPSQRVVPKVNPTSAPPAAGMIRVTTPQNKSYDVPWHMVKVDLEVPEQKPKKAVTSLASLFDNLTPNLVAALTSAASSSAPAPQQLVPQSPPRMISRTSRDQIAELTKFFFAPTTYYDKNKRQTA